MPEPHAGDVAFACMTEFVDELARRGLAGVCISPGSRSAPLVLAFSRNGGVPIHVHLDERSSAFFALGIAKASGRTAAVVCTSGTAAVNFFPAVVEAAQSHTPLLVLTADRPPELRNTGANQTIDQRELYGRYARAFIDAEVPRAHGGAAREWRDLARRALRNTSESPRGPVHINLPFREPLVPTGATVEVGSAELETEIPKSVIEPPDLTSVIELIARTERGVIVAGTLPPGAETVLELAETAGWPLLAEPMSGLRLPGRALAAGQHLLMDEGFAASHVPDVIVQFGGTPTSRATQAFVARAETLIVIQEDGAPADPERRAAITFDGDGKGIAASIANDLKPRDQNPWLVEWQTSDARARAAADKVLDSSDEPFEGRVARDVAAALPESAALVVASSMPVRDLDMYMTPREGVRVIGNRGASGIDGFVSTAQGVASTGVPTTALTGDLSLLHDAGGLIWGARAGAHATFVVLNNRGGGIFDLLPQAGLPEHERLFVTPHAVDLRALAQTAGAMYSLVASAREVPKHVGSQLGVSIIEVPIDRRIALEKRIAVRGAVADALR